MTLSTSAARSSLLRSRSSVSATWLKAAATASAEQRFGTAVTMARISGVSRTADDRAAPLTRQSARGRWGG